MSAKTETVSKTELSYPGRYNIILVNDDMTPMEFVVDLLITIFNKGAPEATAITLAVHTKGSEIAGTYPLEVAEQKHIEAEAMVAQSGYPLEILLEKM